MRRRTLTSGNILKYVKLLQPRLYYECIKNNYVSSLLEYNHLWVHDWTMLFLSFIMIPITTSVVGNHSSITFEDVYTNLINILVYTNFKSPRHNQPAEKVSVQKSNNYSLNNPGVNSLRKIVIVAHEKCGTLSTV